MAYTRYDFEESINRVGIAVESVERVIAAWGESPEDYASWEGGFLLKLRDGRIAYVTGWCDTSGWGCQDGADAYFYETADLDRVQLPGAYGDDSKLGVAEWDEEPADLNQALLPTERPAS